MQHDRSGEKIAELAALIGNSNCCLSQPTVSTTYYRLITRWIPRKRVLINARMWQKCYWTLRGDRERKSFFHFPHRENLIKYVLYTILSWLYSSDLTFCGLVSSNDSVYDICMRYIRLWLFAVLLLLFRFRFLFSVFANLLRPNCKTSWSHTPRPRVPQHLTLPSRHLTPYLAIALCPCHKAEVFRKLPDWWLMQEWG